MGTTEELTKKDAMNLFAELYQICGALGCSAKILDNLSAAANWEKLPYKTLLPFDVEEKDCEPYYGWCDVEDCDNPGCSGGDSWRESGYWTVCHKHSKECQDGMPQPKMKQSAIDRENSRDKITGYLPEVTKLLDKTEEQIIMKTIYALRIKTDNVWSETTYYASRKERDEVARINRIIGGCTIHSFEEKKSAEEIKKILGEQ